MSYSEQFHAIGGVLPLRWAKSGHLPKGLTLKSSGLLAGTVNKNDAPGTYTFTVKVSDKSKPKQTVSGSFQITLTAS